MARFCIVAPVNILQALDERNELGNSHLLLAHDVVKHPKEYRQLMDRKPKRDSRGMLLVPTYARLIILDNSVIELGTAVDLSMIREASDIVYPSCVVLPDALMDYKQTIAQCLEALGTWNLPYPYLMVPQGRTLDEFSYCASAFADSFKIGYWGVPRNLTKLLGTRREAVRILKLYNPSRPIHMMGFSDNLIDDFLVAHSEAVLSIDSAVPLRLRGDIYLAQNPHLAGPRGDWWDTAKYTPLVSKNLNTVRGWLSRA